MSEQSPKPAEPVKSEAEQKYEQALAEERRKREAAERFSQAAAAQARKAQEEAERVRRQYESGYAPDAYEAPPQAKSDPRLDQLWINDGIVRYKMDNPDWAETWGEIAPALSDSTILQKFTIPNSTSVDSYVLLNTLNAHVQNQRFKQAQKEAAEAKAAEESKRNQNKAQAVLSGSSASGEEETLDVSQMTPEEMEKKFPEIFSKTDPPRSR